LPLVKLKHHKIASISSCVPAITVHTAVVHILAVAIFFTKLFLKKIFWKLGLRSGLFWEKGAGEKGWRRGRGQIYLILWLGEII